MFKDFLLKEVNDLSRIESKIAGIRRQHTLRITTLRNIFKIAFFKGNKRLLF